MANSHTLLKYYFIALTPFYKTRFDFQEYILSESLFRPKYENKVLTVNSCSTFYGLYFYYLFCTKPSAQIISCYGTDVQLSMKVMQ